MPLTKNQKQEIVSEIKNILESQNLFLVLQYQGLSVANLEKIRKELFKHNIQAKVFKNRLVKVASKSLNLPVFDKNLVGANIYIFANLEDKISPIKLIDKFTKKYKHFVWKIGLLDKEVVLQEKIAEIALLPSMSEALGLLGSGLVYPLKTLALGLKMLVDENKIAN